MAAISDWVKNLIFLMLFAAFLELLLPTNEMKKFLRMIIGLFIMLAILKPVSNFLANDFVLGDIPTLSVESSKQIASVDKKEVEKKRLTYAVYQKELTQQIKKVVETIPEITDVQVEVKLATENKFTDNEFIEKIMIRAKEAKKIEKIKVNLKENTPQTALSEEVKNKIIDRVSSLCQIEKNKITIG